MGKKTCVKIDESIVASGFFDSFDYVLTDCDGVLWKENTAIPGSVETIQALKKLGKHIIYVTNNGSKSRDEYIVKCKNLNLPATKDAIFSPSYCVATFLKSKNFKKKVYVIGNSGITKELENAGIHYLPIGPDPVFDNSTQGLTKLQLDPEVGAVVVGFDEHISCPKLTKAANYLKNPETMFIATSKEKQFFGVRNIVKPAHGAFIAAIEVATGRQCIALGKPEYGILEFIKDTYPSINFNRCIMIGDSLNTDIMLGTRYGIRTLLVLSGNNSLEDVREFEKSDEDQHQLLVPDYYLPTLGDLRKYITT